MPPPTLRGERARCQLFSEPGAGLDFAALARAATREGGGWLIRREKSCDLRWGTPTGAFGGPQLGHLVALARHRELNGRPVLEDTGVRARIANFNDRKAAVRHRASAC